jgi:hypothetical protein
MMRQVANRLIEELIEIELVLREKPEGIDVGYEALLHSGYVVEGIWKDIEVEWVALKALITLKVLEATDPHLSRNEPPNVLSVLPIPESH